MSRNKGRYTLCLHSVLHLGEELLDRLVVEKRMLEGIVDSLIHPPFGLTLTFELEVTRVYGVVAILVDHVKDLLNTNRIVATIGKHFRLPPRLCLGEELQRIAEVGSGESCSVYILSVGFVYDNTICHLHDSPFDPLQFVSGTGKLDEQKEVYHGVHGGFTLPYTHSFYKDRIKPGSLAQNNGFARFSRHTPQ